MATIKTNFAAIWSLLDNAGIRVRATTVPPRNSYTCMQLADTHAFNAWIRLQGRTRRNLRVADIYAALVNPARTGFLFGYSADGVHPGNKAAPAAGKSIADAFAHIIGPLTPSALDLGSGEGDPSNIMPYNRYRRNNRGQHAPRQAGRRRRSSAAPLATPVYPQQTESPAHGSAS